VGVYIADVPVMRTYGIASMGVLDVASVEVLKGPQGTLFGRNTTGGAIQILPNRPSDELEGEVSMGTGSHGRRMMEGILNVPLGDTLAARFAMNSEQNDGLIPNKGAGDDIYGKDAVTWRTTLRWTPSDALESTLYVDGFKDENAGASAVLRAVRPAVPNNALPFPTNYLAGTGGLSDRLYGGAISRDFEQRQNDDFYSVRSGLDTFSEVEQFGVSNTTTYELNDNLSLKNVLAYRKVEFNEDTDIDGSFTGAIIHSNQFGEIEQYSEELQLLGTSFDDRLKWMTGVFTFKERGEDASISISLGNALVPMQNPRYSGGNAVNKSVSGFGEATYSFTDQFDLTLGLRMTKDEREVTARNGFVGGPCQMTDATTGLPLAVCKKTVDDSWEEPTWNVSAKYRINDQHMVYVAHRHGYRSGGFNIRAATPAQFVPFDPETVDDIELGYKGDFQFGDQLLRFNAATYYSDYKDIQRAVTIFVPGGGLTNLIQNAASGTVQGVELEATWLPTDNLDIRAFYNYVDAQYDEWDDNGVDRSDNRFVGVPKNSGSLSVRYRLPFVSEAAGNVFVQASAYSQAGFQGHTVAGPGADMPSYNLVNARIDWEDVLGHPLKVSAWVKNITEEEYYTAALNVFDSLGITAAYLGDPRTFGFDLSYKF
jgi:iron complex outermembrane recepter protein